MARQTDRSDPSGRRAAVAAGLVAPIIFTLGVVVAGLSWPAYRHRTQNVSDLGGTEAPYASVQNVNFGLAGLLIVLFALGLARSSIGCRTSAAPRLVGTFGVTLLIQGATPCTPGCAQGALTDVLHGLATLTGFGALVVATLLTWRAMRTEAGWTTYSSYSAWTGLVILVFVGVWLTTATIDPEAFGAGVHQRLFIGAAMLWIGATAGRLLPSVNDPTVADDRGAG